MIQTRLGMVDFRLNSHQDQVWNKPLTFTKIPLNDSLLSIINWYSLVYLYLVLVIRITRIVIIIIIIIITGQLFS